MVELLRQNLSGDIQNLDMDEKASSVMKAFLDQIARMERSLLSRKKQRALEEMAIVIEHYLQVAARESNQEEIDHFERILSMISDRASEHQPDWDEVAARWLDVIRPVWYEQLNQPRSRPLLLKDIRAELFKRKNEIGSELVEQFKSFPVQKPTDKRILSCIIGVA